MFIRISNCAEQIYSTTRKYPNFLIMNPFMNASYLKRYTYVDEKIATSESIARIYNRSTQEFRLIIVPNMRTNDIFIGYIEDSKEDILKTLCGRIKVDQDT